MWEITKNDKNRIGTLLTVGSFAFLYCLFVFPLYASKEAAASASLPVLLQRGVEAFANGDFQQAAQVFSQMEEDYKNEKAWHKNLLQRKILPLKGYAELKAGFAQDAVKSLNTFLEKFPDEIEQRGEILYSLGLALRHSDRPEEALNRLEEFENENSETVKAQFSKIQRAEILFTLKRSSEGLDLLMSLIEGSAPESLRNQARLRALQQTLSLNLTSAAATILLEKPWGITTMPEIAVLSFSAMELGHQFLTEGNYTQAIRCFRLVLPREILIRTQTERLEHLKNIVVERAPLARSAGKVFWIDYYQKLISRVTAQLEGLTKTPDYTPALRLHQAQAYLLNKRYHEAWLLCEHLATAPHLTADQTEEAHYRWIFAASGLEEWEDALSIAKSFLERYPKSPLAPEAFYLISQAHLEQRRYAQAIKVFDEIIKYFPDHPMRGRALFTRGFAHTLLENFAEARSDFTHYNNEFPQGHFNVNALLWHALTFFFERQYNQALEELSVLSERQKEHPLYPEILYRKGVTLYAMRQYGPAQTTIKDFTKKFSLHPRFSEALILLGDIYMGQGQLDEAVETYAQISPENQSLFIYATFQTGKILRALENYTSLVSHFINYIGNKEQSPPERISEALYWIGWAYIQLDQPQKALPHFTGILGRYGNNPESTVINSTLSALHKLFAQQKPPVSFNDWLEAHRQTALEQNQLTYFSRLTLFLYNRKKQQKQAEADSLIDQLITKVPLTQLDALGLGKIGQWLYEKDPEKAFVYFDTLVTNFSQSPHRATAFYGLAHYSYLAEDYQETLRWLDKFNRETPGHQLNVQASLLTGKAFLAIGQATDATTQFEKVLRLKAGRGHRHAQALKGLAEAALQLEKNAKAIAYYQRIYTLYRAYPDLVSEAYFKSGLLFEKMGDLQAAKKTFDEMLTNPRLQDATQKAEAEKARERIVSLLPTTSTVSTIP